ncbi:MAG: AmmeMemoRadiSam system protein A [Candidatus Brocadiia bacterium]
MKESNSTGNSSARAYPPGRRPGPLRRLYEWTLHWAETRYGAWALLGLAFAEASFFPIPPDVLLIAMGLGAPRKSLRYAAVCTLGSVLGGVLGYAIGMFFFQTVGQPILELYHYTEQFQRLSAAFGRHGFLYIFAAALTPIPYKVFTIAAGVCHAQVPLGVLLVASVVGRGARFFVVGLLFRVWGRPIKRFIDRYFNLLTVLFVLLLVLGFLCVRIFSGCQLSTGSTAAQPGRAPQQGDSRTMLSEDARQTLLGIARRAVEAAVRGRPIPEGETDHPELQQAQGAFVTLRTGGQLRGCIGQFIAEQPLWRVVREMAHSAATRDPRFLGRQLRPEELDELEVEISVLSPLRPVENVMEEMELGTHGVYIKQGLRSGCFLPQVADETGWGKEEFLANCCAGKAGLAPDAWQDPATEVYVFTAEIIEEGGEQAGG